MNSERFSRQVIAFGKEGQKRLESVRVGIIGLGGIGSQVVQSLAYLGVKEFFIVDDDIMEETNRNRLVGGLPIDVKEKRPKVDIAERLIMQITPGARVKKFPNNLRNEEVLEALTETDFLFGCVDNDSARLILTELSAAYKIPLIDSATEIYVVNGHIQEFGGRVVIAVPGDFCCLCANQIDQELAKIELERPSERKFREEHGYGIGSEINAPAVISLNGIIANLAVTEFLMLLTNMRPANRMVTYKGKRGIVLISTDEKKKDCLVCNSLVGKRELANLKRYAHIGLPKDLPL